MASEAGIDLFLYRQAETLRAERDALAARLAEVEGALREKGEAIQYVLDCAERGVIFHHGPGGGLLLSRLRAALAQPGGDAVVGVGKDGYTFADGSTPRVRDDNAALIEAVKDTKSYVNDALFVLGGELTKRRGKVDTAMDRLGKATVSLDVALAAARAGETPA